MLDVECPKLGEIDLMGTKVDNAVVLSIITLAPLLWHLSLCDTPHITINCIKEVVSIAERLKFVRVTPSKQYPIQVYKKIEFELERDTRFVFSPLH